MSYFGKIRLAAAIAAVIAVLSPVINAEDPKETPIQGTIQLPDKGKQDAAQASLARITAQQAITAAVTSQNSGTVKQVALQNEDGFLAYDIELVSADQRVHDIKVDAGNGTILRSELDAADHEAENGDEAD
jgi:Peptidase propeptide and YPEB domain